MTKKQTAILCWTVIGVSFLLANYAAQQSWPLWSITLAGAVSLGAVLTYLLTAQSQ